MTKPKVLFIGELNRQLPQFKNFQLKYDCIFIELTTRDEFIKDLKTKYHEKSIFILNNFNKLVRSDY